MSVKAELEDGWTRLPADMAPVSGQVIELLRKRNGPGWSSIGTDLLRYGELRRDPPAWVQGRVADWWLVDAPDGEIAIPLVWVGDELTATLAIWREHETNPRTVKERRKLLERADQHSRRERRR